MEILNGKKNTIYDLVVLNASFAVYAADMVDSVKKAKDQVESILASKKVIEKLDQLKKCSNEINS